MKIIITLFVIVVLFVSCARSVTMQQAASNSYRSGRSVR